MSGVSPAALALGLRPWLSSSSSKAMRIFTQKEREIEYFPQPLSVFYHLLPANLGPHANTNIPMFALLLLNLSHSLVPLLHRHLHHKGGDMSHREALEDPKHSTSPDQSQRGQELRGRRLGGTTMVPAPNWIKWVATYRQAHSFG